MLRDDELAAVWRASEGAGVFGRIVQMLILTGQRREEVGGMAWAELSEDLTTWTIPASRAKNGVAHIVPLSAPAQELLRDRRAIRRTRLSRPSRGVQRLVQGEGGLGRALRRQRLAPA